MTIGLDGNLSDWTSADRLEKSNAVPTGYEIYGRFEDGRFVFAIKAPIAIEQNTTLWLNTDRNANTGYQVFGSTVGAEYYVAIDSTGTLKLYNAVTSALIGDVLSAKSADKTTLEFELTAAQLGGSVGAITFTGDVNDATHLTTDYAQGGFTIYDPATNPLDGALTEWTRADRLETSQNFQSGFEVYGKATATTYELALKSDTAIGNNTTFWLNTDQNSATGYNVFGSPTGSEYKINVDAGGVARLYSVTSGGAETLVATLNSMLGPDMKTIEISLPKSLVGNTGRLDIFADVNDQQYIPGVYANNKPLVLVDTTATQHADAALTKIAIVYSESTAAKFFSTMAYSQLFMAAQSQAIAAGIPFDIISESDLTNLAKLSQYDALVFPSFRNVPDNYAAITETLTRLIYDYDVSLIAGGDFMTNDKNGAALPGNSYERMDLLFGVQRTGGDSGAITVQTTASGHSVTEGYTANSTIHQYNVITYSDGTVNTPATSYFTATNAAYAPTTTIATQTVTLSGGATVTQAAVIGTETGARNVIFATESFLADSNLLGKALDWVTNADATVSVSLNMSRNSSIVASRNDMDQSQETADVDGINNGGVGVYDVLMPILQTWKAQYNFVGSYYVNVGFNSPDQVTNWTISKPYYEQLLAMGNEIGSHSYTHPHDTNYLTGLIDTDAKLLAFVTNYKADVEADHSVDAALEALTVAQYNAHLTAALNSTGTLSALERAILTTTFKFQFELSKQIIETQLGITLSGAAVPGMPESLNTAREIIQYYDYLSGGASLVGAGYPGAFGYLSAAEADKVYLAPNMSFDFTLMGWQNLTIEQAKAAWTAEWNSITANSDMPIAIWPWHDYGPTEWIIDSGNPSDYKLEMFTHFIETAFNAGAEFVTLADLAARIKAFEQASFSFTVSGDTITAKATPVLGTQVGTFALDLDDLGTKKIKAVAGWYAYDDDSVFLDADGGEFQIQLGTTIDDVTHITKLDSRMQLVSLTGDGSSLAFTIKGEGQITVALKDYQGNPYTVSGATIVSQVGDQLTLKLPTIGSHAVEIKLINQAPTAIATSGAIALAENTATLTKVANVVITDADIDPLLRNNPVTVSDDRFIFDQTDGGLYLKAGQTVDYETEQTISIGLTTGPTGSTVSTTLVLSVSDVNEAATDIQAANQISLADTTTVRTKVADLTVIDPDTPANFRNNVLAVSDNRFEIDGNALYLKAGQSLNFTSEPAIALTVTATDGALTYSKALSVAVTASVDQPPTAITVSNQIASLAENTSIRTKVADVLVVDPDTDPQFRNNAVIVSDNRFIFDAGALYLLAGQTVNYEAEQTINLTLSTGPGNSVTKPVQIAVGDVNEAPTDILVTNQITLAENTITRIRIADLTVVDPDIASQFRNNVLTVSDNRFEVADGKLYLKAGQVIDYEVSPTIALTLTAKDGSLSYAKTFSLAISDVHEVSKTPVVQYFGSHAGGWNSETKYPRHLADINGDGKADIVGFGEHGAYLSLANGTGGFGAVGLGLKWFAPSAGGWTDDSRYPRHLADVNGDGRADIVGFGENAVFVSLANSQGGFGSVGIGLQWFTPSAGGWSNDERYPRHLADVNGDGYADIVGFGEHAVYVSLGNGQGGFGSVGVGLKWFTPSSGGWANDDKYPRMLADINGDGKADIVGFGEHAVFTALADGQGGFGPVNIALQWFTPSSGGWSSEDRYPRMLADINGDGRADIVGFGENAMYYALADVNGGFSHVDIGPRWFTPSAGDYASNDTTPRYLADITGDGKADIVAFSPDGVVVMDANDWFL